MKRGGRNGFQNIGSVFKTCLDRFFPKRLERLSGFKLCHAGERQPFLCGSVKNFPVADKNLKKNLSKKYQELFLCVCVTGV
jgi:hypothetical protein